MAEANAGAENAEAKTDKKKVTLPRAVPWVVAALALALLVAHALKWDRVQVDGVTLGLLGALLVASSWDRIRKLKLGDFEAEIAAEEVARVRAEVTAQVGAPEERKDEDGSRHLLATLRTDPTLGLAAIRIELERALRSLHRLVAKPSRRSFGAATLTNELAKAGVLSPPLASTLSEVLSIANRAVHGERIRSDVAQDLGRVGIQLIEELRDLYLDTVAEPLASEPVTPAERDRLMNEQRFRVVTIVPLVDQPHMNTRVLDQQALNEFLDGYNEFAEFIISIEPYIEPPQEQAAKRPRKPAAGQSRG